MRQAAPISPVALPIVFRNLFTQKQPTPPHPPASGKDPRPPEVNTERSYYEEQVLTPDKKHEGPDILVSEKAPPHESV